MGERVPGNKKIEKLLVKGYFKLLKDLKKHNFCSFPNTSAESVRFWTSEYSEKDFGAWKADYLVVNSDDLPWITVRVRDGDGSKLPSLKDVDPASDTAEEQIRSIFQRWDRERNPSRRRLCLRLMERLYSN